MLDLLGKKVAKRDTVAYVFQNKHGRTCVVEGIVKKTDKNKCVISTTNGNRIVKNVLRVKQNFLNKLIFN